MEGMQHLLPRKLLMEAVSALAKVAMGTLHHSGVALL